MGVFDEYLRQYGYTRYMLAKKAGINESGLQKAAKAEKLENISTRVMLLTSENLNIPIGEVITDLYNLFKNKEWMT